MWLPIIMFLELFRRFIWSILRVEWEVIKLQRDEKGAVQQESDDEGDEDEDVWDSSRAQGRRLQIGLFVTVLLLLAWGAAIW